MSYRSFQNIQELQGLLAGSVAGIDGLNLRKLNLKDEHLLAIAQAFGPQLKVLEVGDSDTGYGSYFSSQAVQQFVRACPNLTKLHLESATQVDDKAFSAICSSCLQLQDLAVTGNDKVSGKLKSASVKLLTEGKLPELRQLYITDQNGITYNAVEKLTKARGRRLRVQAGETDSDSMAWSMVLQQSGSRYGDGLYGNM